MNNKIDNSLLFENNTGYLKNEPEEAPEAALRKSRLVSQIMLKGEQGDEEINKGRS